jgi:thymidylate synthase (FAD)
MKIIEPYAHLVDVPDREAGIALLKRIEWAARISHRTEEAQTVDSYGRFLRAVVLQHGDWSVVEHVTATVDAVVDRGVTHEWVRHRIAAYTQESTRFVNYLKKMPPSFIYPEVGVRCEYCLAGVPLRPGLDGANRTAWLHDTTPSCEVGGVFLCCEYDKDWLYAIATCEDCYKRLIAKGWPPQTARSVFPNALASRLVCTYNLRSWRNFFIMRTCKEAHPQMRQVTIPLLREFQERIPVLFEDIVPEQRQIEAMATPR